MKFLSISSILIASLIACGGFYIIDLSNQSLSFSNKIGNLIARKIEISTQIADLYSYNSILGVKETEFTSKNGSVAILIPFIKTGFIVESSTLKILRQAYYSYLALKAQLELLNNSAFLPNDLSLESEKINGLDDYLTRIDLNVITQTNEKSSEIGGVVEMLKKEKQELEKEDDLLNSDLDRINSLNTTVQFWIAIFAVILIVIEVVKYSIEGKRKK